MDRRGFLLSSIAFISSLFFADKAESIPYPHPAGGIVHYQDGGDIKIDDKVVFAHHELACPISNCVRLGDGFAIELGTIRGIYDKPMLVTSCCRSYAYNRRINGHPRSLHVFDIPYHPTGGTIAIDVVLKGEDGKHSQELAKELFDIAYARGWSIGIAHDFLHLDMRTSIGLDQNVFYYGDKNEFPEFREL